MNVLRQQIILMIFASLIFVSCDGPTVESTISSADIAEYARNNSNQKVEEPKSSEVETDEGSEEEVSLLSYRCTVLCNTGSSTQSFNTVYNACQLNHSQAQDRAWTYCEAVIREQLPVAQDISVTSLICEEQDEEVCFENYDEEIYNPYL